MTLVRNRPSRKTRLPKYRMIALDRLIPTDDNRRERITVESVKSLGKSLRESGILQPIVVRPHPDKTGYFEIRAGERRWKAAKVAGLTEIPAIVRTLDDPAALAVTLAENIHRKDLHPLEEAETIQLAFERGYDVEAIASQLGKPIEYVARRASLTRLIEPWRKAIRSGESPASRFSPAHMELIARLPADTQVVLAENDFIAVFGRGFPSVDDLRRVIDGGLRTLSTVPWNLDDEFLEPEAGSCVSCSKRSGCHPMLFESEDASTNGKVSKTDRCLDPACYERKLVAHVRRCDSEQRQAHPNLTLVHIGTDRSSPAVDEAFGGQVPRLYSPKIVKSGHKGAVAVMPVDGPRAGKVVYVDGGDSTTVGPSSTKKTKKAEHKPLSLEEKHAQLRRRRQAFVVGKVETTLRELVAERELTVLGERLKGAEARLTARQAFALVLSFGTFHRTDRAHDGEPWKLFDDWSKGDSAEQVVHAVREVLPIWIRRLCIMDKARVGEQFDEVRRIAGLLAIDLAAIESEAERSIPVPKSWAKLGDGAPPFEPSESPESRPTAESEDAESSDVPAVVHRRPRAKKRQSRPHRPARRKGRARKVRVA